MGVHKHTSSSGSPWTNTVWTNTRHKKRQLAVPHKHRPGQDGSSGTRGLGGERGGGGGGGVCIVEKTLTNSSLWKVCLARLSTPRRGTMDAQILMVPPLVGTQGYQRFLISKSGVGQNIALRDAPADSTSTYLISAFLIHEV